MATALAHVREPVPELPDNVPAELAGVVYRCLAKNPRERFKDAGALAAALRNPSAATTMPTPAAVAPPAATAVLTGLTPARGDLGRPAPPPRRRISPWWLVLPILLLLALVGFALWQELSADDDPAVDDERAPSATSSSSAPTTEPTQDTVFVGADVCDGNINDVTNRIADLGLAVNPVELDNPGGEQPNEVESCSPTGAVRPDQTIEVRYWGEPAPPPTSDSPTVSETVTITEDTDGPGQGNEDD